MVLGSNHTTSVECLNLDVIITIVNEIKCIYYRMYIHFWTLAYILPYILLLLLTILINNNNNNNKQ